MSSEARGLEGDTRGQAMLWFGVFAGPFAWATQLQLNYSLVGWACANGAGALLHVITILAILISVAGIFAAKRSGDRLRAAAAENNRVWERRMFVAKSGLMFSAFFVVVIAAHEIPNVILRPCAW